MACGGLGDGSTSTTDRIGKRGKKAKRAKRAKRAGKLSRKSKQANKAKKGKGKRGKQAKASGNNLNLSTPKAALRFAKKSTARVDCLGHQTLGAYARYWESATAEPPTRLNKTIECKEPARPGGLWQCSTSLDYRYPDGLGDGLFFAFDVRDSNSKVTQKNCDAASG